MKAEELKLRLIEQANSLIDTYYGEKTIIDRFMNTTLKILLKNNINKINGFLSMFKNEFDEINAEEIINMYANNLGDEGLELDIRDYIEDSFICGILPQKKLLIKPEDILHIINH